MRYCESDAICRFYLSPPLRFYHLSIGESSNHNLQLAIAEDGIKKYLYIMEIVIFPAGMNYQGKLDYMNIIEQRYMDKLPREQLYNTVRAKGPQ